MEVLADRADFFFAPLIVALPFLKDGRLQALAVSGSQRAAALPDVPTTVEAGFPNSEYNFWVGMFGRRRRLLSFWTSSMRKPARRCKIRPCRRSSHAWAPTR